MLVDPLKEELHPDLQSCLINYGQTVSVTHPLVIMPISQPYHVGIINRIYADKTQQRSRAFNAGDWFRYIWLHERDFRPEVLCDIAEAVPDDRFWTLVAQVWRDAECFHHAVEYWRIIWQSDRPLRDRLMTDAEHASLAKLNDPIRIYRGFTRKQAVRGLSWSLATDDAERYAKSANGKRWLATATVRHSKISALFHREKECEMVILPDHLENIEINKLA